MRHSTPDGEVAETHAKAAGVLGALGLGDPPAARGPSTRADDPAVQAALAARNDHLARFWLDAHPRPEALAVPALAGRTALVVDGEDTFTGMLAHQLRALGLAVEVARWDSAYDASRADLLVVGPGPGDPTSIQDPKMASLRAQLVARLGAGAPLLAICLGHQLLAGLLGLRLHRRDAPYQGIQRVVDLFGVPRRVGFYSTYTAMSPAATIGSPHGPVRLARDAADGAVHALRGPGFAGLQFHPESVLSEDGLAVLADLVPALVGEAVAAEPA